MPARPGYAVAACLLFAPLCPAAPAEAPAKPAPADPDALIKSAAAAEKAAQWDRALELYLKAYTAGRQTPEVREKVRDCLRRSAQAKRSRDPGFQQFVLNLPPADALNLYAEVLEKLRTTYADRDRAAPDRLFEQGLAEFDRALTDPAFRDRHLDADPAAAAKFRKAVAAEWKGKSPKTAREARQAVFAVAAAAGREAGLQNPSAVVFEFLCGACGGLDEYTVYLSPSTLQSEVASPVLELAGYGVLVAFRGEAVVVEGVVPDSWAALNTNLRPGDRIAGVNGRPLRPGTAVALRECLRFPIDGAHELDVATPTGMMPALPVRLPTPVPTVARAEILKDGIGYVRITGLRDTTPAEFEDALLRLRDRGMRGLVLDLRGNPGGLFTAGVRVAGRFVPSGIIATTQGQAGDFADRVFSSDSGMNALDVPLVLLIDTKTMSSAEVIAAALRDHNRATLVGMLTFGKGAIQYPFPLRAADEPAESGLPRPRSGVLIVTIARAFSPRGAAIHGVGVMPHMIEADSSRQLTLALERAVELAGGR